MNALLQIQEPDAEPQAAPKYQAKTHGLGIDLGTTHSIVSVVCKGEGPEVMHDEQGERIIPSVVYYSAKPGEVLVGKQAAAKRYEDPANCIYSVKRLIGRGYDEVASGNFAKLYDLAKSESNLPLIVTNQGAKSPVEISAEVLKYVTGFARARLQEEGKIGGAVITVPAYFDDAQRQAVKDAAQLAGIKLYRLINEPTAAALAYALDKQAKDTVAVYDLGGGTFDISILRLDKGVFRVLATGGNTALGGDDFDAALAELALTKLNLPEQTTPVRGPAGQAGQYAPAEQTPQEQDPSDEEAQSARGKIAQLTRIQQQALLAAAKQAKEQLSTEQEARINLADYGLGSCSVSRAELNTILRPFIAESLQIMTGALADAQVAIEDIADVVLVGGSTRIPAVRAALAEFFQREPLGSIDPDLVVAMGAAIQAEVLAGNAKDSALLLDVIPLSLGLETMGGLNEKLIRRNSSIPVAATHDFTTYKDGQSAMSFHILQGERELVQDCRSLAHFTLRGIPPQPAGRARVRVTFRVDADGLLSVSAQDLTSGKVAEVEVHPTYGMSEQDFKRILQQSFAMAEEDSKQRQLRLKQEEAKQLLAAIDRALQDQELPPTPAERSKITPPHDQLRQLLEQADSPDKLAQGIKLLSEAAESFISRRMSQAFKQSVKK